MTLATCWTDEPNNACRTHAASGTVDEHGEAQHAAIALAFEKCIRPCTRLAELGIPRRERVLGDWFMEGDCGFIFAPRGVGKTWLSLSLAVAIAEGGRCGPWQAHGARTVLYVDGEMPLESIDGRIRGMGGKENLLVLSHEALFHLGGQSLNLAQAAAQKALTARLLATGVQVLVLDNLSCLFSGVKENEADAWEPVKLWLLTLRRHRISVVIVHHAGRNAEMRGTSRREDDVFWIIKLVEVGEEQRKGAQFLVSFTKNRNAQESEPSRCWRFTTGEDGRVSVELREASSISVFRQWVADGLTRASDIALEMGISKGSVSKLAKKAEAEGWLTIERRQYVLREPNRHTVQSATPDDE